VEVASDGPHINNFNLTPESSQHSIFTDWKLGLMPSESVKAL